MFGRYRALIALFAIVLQALDGIVGAVGHSHGDELVSCEAQSHEHHGVCAHQQHIAAEDEGEHYSLPDRSQPSPHDDCSLCRHFSQPVLSVTVTVEVVGSQYCAAVAAPLVERIAVAIRPTHPARGPPALIA